jgi:hypothetical protein
MQEIVLILSSLAGVATAVAARKMPRGKNQLLSLGASSHIKSQINSLKIEKDILTKTITRLYQTDSEFSKIQKDKLLLRYQHQLGIVLAKLEKLEQASEHPDLGPIGDGLITLMDQKLSKLDDRLYEISSKMVSTKTETPKTKESEVKNQESKPFNFEKPKKTKTEPIGVTPTRSKQSFELTTLTNFSKKESKFPLLIDVESKQEIVNPMPQSKVVQSEIIKPKEEIVQEIIQPRVKVEDKIEIIQSFTPKAEPVLETKPNIDKEVAKITEHKALPEPEAEQKPRPITSDDDFNDDADDLDKIKENIMKVMSKLDQAEVE